MKRLILPLTIFLFTLNIVQAQTEFKPEFLENADYLLIENTYWGKPPFKIERENGTYDILFDSSSLKLGIYPSEKYSFSSNNQDSTFILGINEGESEVLMAPISSSIWLARGISLEESTLISLQLINNSKSYTIDKHLIDPQQIQLLSIEEIKNTSEPLDIIPLLMSLEKNNEELNFITRGGLQINSSKDQIQLKHGILIEGFYGFDSLISKVKLEKAIIIDSCTIDSHLDINDCDFSNFTIRNSSVEGNLKFNRNTFKGLIINSIKSHSLNIYYNKINSLDIDNVTPISSSKRSIYITGNEIESISTNYNNVFNLSLINNFFNTSVRINEAGLNSEGSTIDLIEFTKNEFKANTALSYEIGDFAWPEDENAPSIPFIKEISKRDAFRKDNPFKNNKASFEIAGYNTQIEINDNLFRNDSSRSSVWIHGYDLKSVEILNNRFINMDLVLGKQNPSIFYKLEKTQIKNHLLIAENTIESIAINTTLPDNKIDVLIAPNQINNSKLQLSYVFDGSFSPTGESLVINYYPDSIQDCKNWRALGKLKSYYTEIREVYKDRGDLDGLNATYVTLKEIEGVNLHYKYSLNPSLKNWFSWKLNQLLKFYTEHGTDPAKSLVISFWLLLAFAAFYFFFPSEWDIYSKSAIVQNFKKSVDKNDKQVFRPLIRAIAYVLLSFLNALTLSLNSFVTLGFGNIPTKGIARYVCILQGFLGWFLLSIFSVALINQVLPQ